MQPEDLQQIQQIVVENNKHLATKDDLDALALSIKNGFDAVDERFNAVDEKFEDVYKRLDGLDAKLGLIQKELGDIKERLAFLEKRTIEDGNVLSVDVVDLGKRVIILENQVKQLLHN